jgi:type I restriction enzyme S subunit
VSKGKTTRIGQFLFEREGKYKPDAIELDGLKRIDKIDFSGNFHIAEKPSNTNMILIKAGDLVISGINVAKGAMAIYQGHEDVTATIHYSSYTFDETQIEVEYFKRFLRSPEFVRLLKEQVKGGIKTEIKPKHLLALEIPLPTLNEQKKVVTHFLRFESEQAELNYEITYQKKLLNNLRQRIFQEAIEGRLTASWRKLNHCMETASTLLERIIAEKAELIKNQKIKPHKPRTQISDKEKPFELPQEWIWCPLGDIANGFQYGTSSKSLVVGKIPVLRMGNIQSGEVSWDGLVFSNDDDEIEKYKVEDGDLLFNRTNSRELVGKTALFRGDRQSIFAGYLVRFRMALDICPEYANFVMNSILHNEWCNEVKTDALGQSNINATKLRMFRFPLPPLLEQSMIVEKVKKLLMLCDQLEAEIASNQSIERGF